MSLLRTLYKCLRLRLQADDEAALPFHARHADEPEPVLYRRHVPLLLSSEEEGPLAAVGPQKDDDMHACMDDEDERRRRLFQIAADAQFATTPTARPGRGRQAPSQRAALSAHVAYQLGTRTTKHVYSCSACGALTRLECAALFFCKFAGLRCGLTLFCGPPCAQVRGSCGRRMY